MHSADRIEPDGERKQVTVLFADVKGSMDLAEQQDSEEVRRFEAPSTSSPAARRRLHPHPGAPRCTPKR